MNMHGFGLEFFLYRTLLLKRTASFLCTHKSSLALVSGLLLQHSGMPSFVGSQGAALVAAAAVSGTLILLLLRPKRMVEANQAADRRPSISSDHKGGKKTRILRKVQFATDVLEPSGDNEDYRRRRRRHDTVALTSKHEDQHRCHTSSPPRHHARAGAASYHGRKMPENRVVLYNGILRDRLQRTASMY